MGICSDDSRIIVYSVKWSAGILPYGIELGRPKTCGWNLSSQIRNLNPGWKIFLERLIGNGQDNFVLKIGLQKHSSGGTVFEGLAYCVPPLPGKVIKQLFPSPPFKKKKSSSLFLSCIRKQEKQWRQSSFLLTLEMFYFKICACHCFHWINENNYKI